MGQVHIDQCLWLWDLVAWKAEDCTVHEAVKKTKNEQFKSVKPMPSFNVLTKVGFWRCRKL